MADENAVEDLNAAWDAVESEDNVLEEPNESQLESVEVLESTEGLSAGGADQGQGELVSDQHGGGSDEKDLQPDTGEAAGAADSTTVDSKPPVGLSASAREVWKDTPKAMQDEMAKREGDYARGIQQYAEGSKQFQAMNQTLKPFHQYLAMNGGPQATIQNLLQTGATLQMGTPMQRAQMTASIIQQFGVDIATLDSLITGDAPPAEAQQNDQFNQMLNERLGPMQQQLAHYQAREQQENQQFTQNANNDVTAFSQDPKNEFYEDVKMDMADILDLASNRGQNMTLKDAYDKACILSKDVAGIIGNRASQESVTKKRRAASSVRGNLGGQGDAALPGSMRDAIESAWDGLGQV